MNKNDKQITEKVLITDGRQRSTLAVVRSLGGHGVSVTVAEDRFPCLSSRSNSCTGTFQYPAPSEKPAEFIEALEKELKQNKYDMLLPMTDITSMLISQHRERFEALTRLPMPDKATFNSAIDKGEVITLCQTLGIPVPKTTFIDNLDELEKIKSELTFPVVIKPRQSKYLTGDGWVETGVTYAYDFDELSVKLKKTPEGLPLPMLQERIEGPGEGAFLLFQHGEPKAVFFHKRLRERPPSGGVSVLRESITVDDRFREYAVKLLSALNWHGPAMVEFKVDRRDSLPKVMEINARFWGSLQLGIDAGVDFPFDMFRITMGHDITPTMTYKTGIKCRWLLGDVDNLLARLFKSDRTLQVPEGYPGRLKTIWEFLKFVQADTKYEVFKLTDMGPFLQELKEYIGHTLGSVFGRIFRG